jgi:hypothetical protein
MRPAGTLLELAPAFGNDTMINSHEIKSLFIVLDVAARAFDPRGSPKAGAFSDTPAFKFGG